jgi:uncharacterized protein YwgA
MRKLKMNADTSVILTLYYSDSEMIAGRTLLQKTLYFLSERLDLGLDFMPHYYGPYSTEVTEVISSLKATGIIEEKVERFLPFNFSITFEPRRYTYRLTEIGKEIALLIADKEKESAKMIKDVLEEMKELGANNDYKNLSIAAKMHQILNIEGKKMTAEEILDEAESIGWDIKEKEAKSAIEFLEKMKMIKIDKQRV